MPRKKASAFVLSHDRSCPFPRMVLMRSVLSVVFKINRLCIRSIPPFTMSEIMIRKSNDRRPNQEVCPSLIPSCCCVVVGLPTEARGNWSTFALKGFGGQPSLAFASEGWWSRSGSNRRPQACKASALPTELRPRSRSWRANRSGAKQVPVFLRPGGLRKTTSLLRSVGWWARDELNVRPHAYQACALTT